MGLFGRNKKTAEADPPADSNDSGQGGLFRRLVRGLKKTVSTILGSIGSLVAGRRIDDDLIDEIEDVLYTADLGTDLVPKIIDRLREAWKKKEIEEGEQVIPFLKGEFKSVLTARSNAVNIASAAPTVILVVGVNGTGKTTSIGKLAWHFVQGGRKVMVAAGDTYRAAAENQLKVWAEDRVSCDFHQGDPGDKPDKVAYTAVERAQAEGHDILIIDTAGRLHTDLNLMEQLSKVKRVIGKLIPAAPHEVLLVLDANIGQNAMRQAEVFRDKAGVTGLFLAKLDATGKGGVVLNIHDRFDIPVKFVGLGEQKEDYAPFDADQFVEALFANDLA